MAFYLPIIHTVLYNGCMNIADIDKILMIEPYGGFKKGARANVVKMGNQFYAEFGKDYLKTQTWVKNAIKKGYAKPVRVFYGNDSKI